MSVAISRWRGKAAPRCITTAWRCFAMSALILYAILWPSTARAHLTPNSQLQIDFGSDRAVFDIIIPQSDYVWASGAKIGDKAAAQDFLKRHFAVRSDDGAGWAIDYDLVEFVQIAGPPDLHALATLRPPPGRSARILNIYWSAVIDRDPIHFTIVLARSDFGKAQHDMHSVPEVVGTFQGDRRILRIDRGAPSYWQGFAGSVRLGMRHIVDGHDHLLFLITLLLPTPLFAAARRWTNPRSPGSTVWQFAEIVTAFTLGHSITLICGALFDWDVPAKPIEVMIAGSIFLSAVHAWRPLFPRREPMIAGLFGLVHGMAFATLIGGFGLGPTEKALAILGFNLGIELVQFAIVLLILPALLLMARTACYAGFRTIGAGLAAIASTAWIIGRLRGSHTVVGDWLESFFSHGLLLIGLFTMLAILLSLLSAKRDVNLD